jgi:3-hydroxyisobutyrate dehydrogenase-like beta-hydroxyacid dehydrogenase
MQPCQDTRASPVRPVGDVGSGQRIKLVNNAMFVAQAVLAVDAVRLGNALGLSEEPSSRRCRPAAEPAGRWAAVLYSGVVGPGW